MEEQASLERFLGQKKNLNALTKRVSTRFLSKLLTWEACEKKSIDLKIVHKAFEFSTSFQDSPPINLILLSYNCPPQKPISFVTNYTFQIH